MEAHYHYYLIIYVHIMDLATTLIMMYLVTLSQYKTFNEDKSLQNIQGHIVGIKRSMYREAFKENIMHKTWTDNVDNDLTYNVL